MRRYSFKSLVETFKKVGIEKGDLIYVETSLYNPGRIAGLDLSEMSSRLYSALRKTVGKEGTIVVPTFYYSFMKGEPFDIRHSTAVGMGSFCEYMRMMSLVPPYESLRSPHAIYSVTANGPLAESLTSIDTSSAFECDGVFHSMIKQKAKVIMFGKDFEGCHLTKWAERTLGVPYRKWASFKGAYTNSKGETTERIFRAYLRKDNVTLNYTKLIEALDGGSHIQKVLLGSGVVSSCCAQEFATVAMEVLSGDSEALLNS